MHVAQIERSIAYYEMLGLTVERRFPERGKTTWAHLRNGDAQVILQQVNERVDGATQTVLFYLFVDDLATLRQRLLNQGAEVGEIEDGRNRDRNVRCGCGIPTATA